MKRSFLTLTMVLACAMFLAVCTVQFGHAADTPDPKTSAVLNAAGASPGGVGFVLLTGISKFVKQSFPRVEITVVPGGFVGNLMRVNKGEMDMAATTTSLALMAENKEPPYDKEDVSHVRSLFSTQNPFNFFAIVRKDLEANTLKELFEKKLPVKLCTLNKGTAAELVWRNVFLSQGVSWEDVSDKWGGSVSFVTWADAVNLVKDGHADGILAVGASKIGWAMDLSHARDVKILKWDEDLFELVRDRFGLLTGKIAKGSYHGIDEDIVVPYTPCEVIIRESIPDDVVTAILTAMYEHADDYAKYHTSFADFVKENMATGIKLPLHPAAKKFFESHDIPIR